MKSLWLYSSSLYLFVVNKYVHAVIVGIVVVDDVDVDIGVVIVGNVVVVALLIIADPFIFCSGQEIFIWDSRRVM